MLVNKDGTKMNGAPDFLVPKGTKPIGTVAAALRDLELIDPEKIIPLQFRVLVKVMTVDEISVGGIILSESEVEKTIMSKTYAEFITCSPEAFTQNGGDYVSNKPEKGDLVITTKYPGNPYRDKDNNLYRFCNDVDIVSVVKENK
jgi:co-chaperonin GroES (HSP10)